MRLVLASNNAKKLSELQQMLQPLGVALVTQGSLGIDEADEPHVSFVENALAKARHASAAADAPAIADDSGLCVAALGGAPGVASAVYAPLPEGAAQAAGAGREALRRLQDAANNTLLLQRLQDLPGDADRRAYFSSTLVAVRHAADPEPLVAVGRWPGRILSAPRGMLGFGYDPLMYIGELDATVAELLPEIKNRHSHRARAMLQMQSLLHEVWKV